MRYYLVTGATSGIGEACVKKLANDDTCIIIVGRNQDKLSALKENLPGIIEPVPYDLDNIQDIEKIFAPCKEKQFKLNGMIYCAGADELRPIKSINTETMQSLMRINCFSFVRMCKYFYSKRYSADGSSIVAVSSLSSRMCDVGMVSYSMSKAALNAAVKTAAKEFTNRRIRVNAILPGGVSSRMSSEKGELLSDVVSTSSTTSKNTHSENKQPFGLIPCDDMARIICYLLGDEAKYMTGEIISVSGGLNHNL